MAGGLLLLAAASIAAAAPFPTRDQNPLLTGFGLPHPLPARIVAAEEWDFAAAFNWGSSAIAQTNAREALVVDAETRELRLSVAYGLADRFALQLQVPYRYTGAGTLDGFIDDWHSWFGLPEGARRILPSDDYRIMYARGGVMAVNSSASSSGLADISADVGYRIADDAATAVAAWLSVKLPTGDAAELTGSGAADVSLALAGEQRFAGRWSVFGQGGVSYLGEGDLLPMQQRSVVYSGLVGLGAEVTQSLALKVQVDAHSAVFDDTQLDFLGDTAILTVGGSYRFGKDWQLDVGVSEDIVVDGSPDVVFMLGLQRL